MFVFSLAKRSGTMGLSTTFFRLAELTGPSSEFPCDYGKSLLVLVFAFYVLASQESPNFQLAGVPCPIRRCRLPKDIFHVRSGPAVDEQPHNVFVAPPGRLMQRRGM